jgi:hypothetical protein
MNVAELPAGLHPANGGPITVSPQRIQLRRTKGWRLDAHTSSPLGAVIVDRRKRWGNPFVVHEHTDRCGEDLIDCPLNESEVPVDSAAEAVRRFRWLYEFPCQHDPEVPDLDTVREHLAGRDLACWCPVGAPCHADVLLELANEVER